MITNQFENSFKLELQSLLDKYGAEYGSNQNMAGMSYSQIQIGYKIADSVEAEREACAKICDNNSCDYTREGAEVCAVEIRERANPKHFTQ